LRIPQTRTLAYAAWASVCVIWGTTYLAIKIALETLPPFLMGGLRWVSGGVVLVVALRASRQRFPSPHDFRTILLLAFLFIVLGNGGVVLAEQWVPSGLTAVIIATSPFWMVGIEQLLPDREHLTGIRVGGLLMGFAGIVLLVWPDIRGGGNAHFLAGVVCLQVACVGWAVGSTVSRRFKPAAGTLMVAALEMVVGGILMLGIGTMRGEWGRLAFTTRTTVALAYLASVGAVGGFGSYVYALRHLPVSFVSLYSYINPIIAVLLGSALLGEPLTLRTIGAAALVLAGAALVVNTPRRGPP
jgi:drug/metabolite transporter (DMT)-like permease